MMPHSIQCAMVASHFQAAGIYLVLSKQSAWKGLKANGVTWRRKLVPKYVAAVPAKHKTVFSSGQEFSSTSKQLSRALETAGGQMQAHPDPTGADGTFADLLLDISGPGRDGDSPAIEIRVQSLYLKKLGSMLIDAGDELRLLIEKEKDVEVVPFETESQPGDQSAQVIESEGPSIDVAGAVAKGSLLLTGLRGTMEERREQLKRAYAGLLAMARPHNYLPSAILVLLGAYLARRDWAVVLDPVILLVGVLSGLIALASMIANDVFDFRSGVDKVNGPSKPLVTGEIHPDDAELTAGCLYGAVVLGCCCLDSLPLRLLVGGSTVATYLYTPFLKKLTLVKNMVVAGIIASSVPAGGLAAGGLAGLQSTMPAFSFLFLSMLFREMVMDVSDINGDRGAGVMTVPVRLGQRGGLAVALTALAAANCLLVWSAGGLSLPSIGGTLFLTPLYGMTFKVLAEETPSRDKLGKLVDQSMLMIGLSLLLVCSTS